LSNINEWLLVLIVLLALMLVYLAGFTFGKSNFKEKGEKQLRLITTIQTGLLALLGIMLAFSFSLASTRFEKRRELVITESMNIGTSYFRAGLLPDTLKRDLRKLLIEYLNVRTNFYKEGNSEADMVNIQRTARLIQVKLWYKTVTIGRDHPNLNTNANILALNPLIEISGNISSSFQNHVPRFIITLLIFVAACTIFTLGYCHGFSLERNALFAFILNAVICSILLLIIDMDRPTSGFLKADVRSLTELKNEIERYSKY
jgi:hypothetical protein